MDDTKKISDEIPGKRAFLKTLGAGLIAAMGFACMSAWGVYVILAPAMPILSFIPTDQGISCLIISRFFSIVALMLCTIRPTFIQVHIKRLVFPVMVCAYLPLVIFAVLGSLHTGIPFFAICASWALCGIADIILPYAWMSILSCMPTRQIALSIAVGGILVTPLFVLLACSSLPIVSILSAIGMLLISSGGAYVLLDQIDNDIDDEDRWESTPMPISAMVSLAAHSLVYGYVAIMLCSLDLASVVIAGSFGLISSCIAAWWLRNFNKRNWDTDRSQRLTIPFVVAAVLIVPLTGDIGRTLGAALAIGAFSYVTLMEWTGVAVANAEFHLAPDLRQIHGMLARWIGFTAGAIVSFVAFYIDPVSQMSLMWISSVLVLIVVTAFAVFEGIGRNNINELLKFVVENESSEELVIDPPKNAAPFRDRCNAIIEKGNLTPRESEVFLCLAKGRNTEYIQGKLFISASTARTHILHIYRKLEINSQQQLIDLVDLRDHHE